MDKNPTGLDLKIERIRAGVMVKDLAAAMTITPSRLSRIEVDVPVTDRMLARYRAALGTCRTEKAAA
jgi:plasmid maintenance system antidote protein VapI